MRIREVTAANFLTLEGAEFRLDEQGLVLVHGINAHDTAASSNGSGKSSLLDAVCWGLWGTTARGSTGDAIMRAGQKAEANVQIVLEDEHSHERWLVVRTRRKGKGTLVVHHKAPGVAAHDISLGTEKLTQALIEKIVGCTEKVFRAAIYVGQEQMPDLPAMTDKHLKELVEEAAGISQLTAAYEIARQKANVCGISTREFDNQVVRLEMQRDALLAQRLQAEENEKHWALNQRNDIVDFEDQGRTLHREIKDWEHKIASQHPKAKIEAAIARLAGQLAGFKADQDTERDLLNQIQGFMSKLVLAEQEFATNETALARERKHLAQIKDEAGKPCPECGTPMDASHLDHTKKAAEVRIEKMEDAVACAGGAAQGYQANVDVAQQAFDAHRKTMGDPTEIAEKRFKFQALLHVITGAEGAIASLCERIDAIGRQVTRKKCEVNPHSGQVAELNAKLSDAADRIATSQQKLAQARSEHAQMEAVVQVFGPAGVRAHILDEVTPFLNERTSEYLGTLTDGAMQAVWTTLARNAKGELREKFAIDVTHCDGARSFSEISGGEKRKMRIACALALQDLVASRATKSFGLWVGDEIDDALDTAGLERLMMVLQEKARDRGTVVVISHNDLNAWIPKVWAVTKHEANRSTLAVN